MAFNPINLVRGLFTGKDNYTQTPIFSNTQLLRGKQPLWVTLDNKEGQIFNSTPELYSVIMRKATMYTNGIFKHYKIDANGEKTEIENSDILKVLNNPNPLQSRNEWLMDELIQTSVFGSSFVYGLRPYASAMPEVFWNLPSNLMKIVPTGKIYEQSKIDGIIQQFILTDDFGNSTPYEVNDVMYSRTQNPENPILGKSPLHPLQMPISNIRGAYGYRNVLINERGAIGMISGGSDGLGGSVPLKRETRNKIEKQLVDKDYGIQNGKSRVMIVTQDAKWQPMTYPTKDLMLFEEISADFNTIIDAYGMKAELFSKEKGSTFSNLLEAKKSIYQDSIIPYANDFTYKLTNYLGLDKLKECIELDYSHVEALQENQEALSKVQQTKSTAYNNLLQSGNFTHEEIRDILGL